MRFDVRIPDRDIALVSFPYLHVHPPEKRVWNSGMRITQLLILSCDMHMPGIPGISRRLLKSPDILTSSDLIGGRALSGMSARKIPNSRPSFRAGAREGLGTRLGSRIVRRARRYAHARAGPILVIRFCVF